MKRGPPRHNDILTPREWQVLALLADRQTNPEIAARLGITTDGVKYHVSQILAKLGVERLGASTGLTGRNSRTSSVRSPSFGGCTRGQPSASRSSAAVWR